MILFLFGAWLGASVVGLLVMFGHSCGEYEEQFCGCDGEGMAHVPGSRGFACAALRQPISVTQSEEGK